MELLRAAPSSDFIQPIWVPNNIVVLHRYIVNAYSGCLAYPSASAGYREDCADNGAGRQVGALEVRWMHNPALRNGSAAPSEMRGAEWA